MKVDSVYLEYMKKRSLQVISSARKYPHLDFSFMEEKLVDEFAGAYDFSKQLVPFWQREDEMDYVKMINLKYVFASYVAKKCKYWHDQHEPNRALLDYFNKQLEKAREAS